MRNCFLICVLSVFLYGCSDNQTAVNENRAANKNVSNKPEPPKNLNTPFDKALFSVRVADFDQVLVFRRKDGGDFNNADKDFLRQNSPNAPEQNVNRWIRCDDGKCYIAGTNFDFSRANLIALQNRFEVKDWSKGDGVDVVLPPEKDLTTNTNANANKKN